MILIHEQTNSRDDYHYFKTDRSVTVQIGRSTNPRLYAWSVYHPDIKCAIWGGESESLDEAKEEASIWVLLWVHANKT